MKTYLSSIAILLVLTFVLPAAALAGHGKRGGGERFFDRMAEALDLTEEQQAQIREIRSQEKEKIAPLRELLEQSRERLHERAVTQPFDEGAVRELAARQADTRTELIVARARMMNRIQSVLTPEQREKAEKFRPEKKKRGHSKGRAEEVE